MSTSDMEKQTILYLAYGSNCNFERMSERCTGAKMIKNVKVAGYRLAFRRGYATLIEDTSAETTFAVWELTPAHFINLDRYEGYPYFYDKKNIPIEISPGETVDALAYVVQERFLNNYNLPSAGYISTCRTGYANCRIDPAQLNNALKEIDIKRRERRLFREESRIDIRYATINEYNKDQFFRAFIDETISNINAFVQRLDRAIEAFTPKELTGLVHHRSNQMRRYAILNCAINDVSEVFHALKGEDDSRVILNFLQRTDEKYKLFTSAELSVLFENHKFFEIYKSVINEQYAQNQLVEGITSQRYDTYIEHLNEYATIRNAPILTSEDLREMIKRQAVGSELELHVSCADLADIIEQVTNGTKSARSSRDKSLRHANIQDEHGRIWGVDSDCSIPGAGAELVTPRLLYSEIAVLEKMIEVLRQKGVTADMYCGLHTHVDAAKYDNTDNGPANPLNRLLTNMYVDQDVICEAFDVPARRETFFARKLKEDYVDEMLNATKPKERFSIWYQDWHPEIPEDRLNPSRYRIVNLHSYFTSGRSIEFRMFNMHMDMDVIKAYMAWTLAFSFVSQNNLRMPPALLEGKSPRQSVQEQLSAIGLCGDEFAKTRDIITSPLSDKIVNRDKFNRYMEKYEKYKHGRSIEN